MLEAKVKWADTENDKLGFYDYAIFGSISGNFGYVSGDTLQEDSKVGTISFYAF